MKDLLAILSLKLWALLMALLTVHYAVAAGVLYLLLYIKGKRTYSTLKIQQDYPEKNQIFLEIKYSLTAFCAFGISDFYNSDDLLQYFRSTWLQN